MKILKRGITWALAVFSILLAILPESLFSHCCWVTKEFIGNYEWLRWIDAGECNIVITRVGCFIGLVVICSIISLMYSVLRCKVKIKGDNYSIVIEYGDLLKKKNCKRVINFDECYTTTVGIGPADIKKTSICGQYLEKNSNLNIQQLILNRGAKPCRRKSKYNSKTCYEPGTIVPNGDDLLMAFARLDTNGSGLKFTVEEYLRCLSLLWKEIDSNYCQMDVCIPILGSGITRFENGNSQTIPQQELLNMMISSYRLSPYKIKSPCKLRIVCKRSYDFSLENIDA